MEKGMLFDIQKNSYVDGPGIRTTAFFKGCNLRCKWCHNPESQSGRVQMMFYGDLCVGCGKCKEVCPHHLESCELCGRCELFCPRDARKVCGREYTADEVVAQLLKDKAFYENSGGGVTFSGGECMLQIDFLAEVLRLCAGHGLHTAVDTAGAVEWSRFEKILPVTSLFLYDVKCASEEKHIAGTGVSNRLILENLKRLSDAGADIIIRVPVIGGFNDSAEEAEQIAELLRDIKYQYAEILPYHAMGENKYSALNMDKTGFYVPSEEIMDTYVKKIAGARRGH